NSMEVYRGNLANTGSHTLSRAEDEAGARIRAQQVVRHLALGDLVEGLPGAMERHDIFRPHLLQRHDGLAHIVLLVGCEMKSPDHRMNLVDTRCRSSSCSATKASRSSKARSGQW